MLSTTCSLVTGNKLEPHLICLIFNWQTCVSVIMWSWVRVPFKPGFFLNVSQQQVLNLIVKILSYKNQYYVNKMSNFFWCTCTGYPDKHRTLHKFDITFSLSRTQVSSIFVRKKKQLYLTFWFSIFHEMRVEEFSLIKYLHIAPGVINFAEKKER